MRGTQGTEWQLPGTMVPCCCMKVFQKNFSTVNKGLTKSYFLINFFCVVCPLSFV